MSEQPGRSAPPGGPTDEQPSFRELFVQQLQSQGLGRTLADGQRPDVLATMGGVRGILEAVVPVVVFSTWYGFQQDLRTAIIASLVPAVALALWRLVAREPVTMVLGGVLGVALGAVVASRTGRAEDYFLPSILKNLGWMALYLVSVVARWPLIGVVLGFVLGEGTDWRRVPARRRVYTQASLLWAGMFALRAAVQAPLWFTGQVAALGVVNVFLGLPLFFLTIWLTWTMVHRVPPAVPAAAPGPAPQDAPQD